MTLVCLLQPTSPLRKTADILAGYHELKEKNADAITAVCEVDHSPLWTMTLNEDLSLCDFRRQFINAPRQQIKTYYRINGALYIRKVLYQKDQIKILEEKEYAYIMDRQRSVDIDTSEDFEYAKFLIQMGHSKM